MSFAGPRWSSLGGREGRKRSRAAGSRRRLAHQSSGGGSGVLGFRGGDLARKREKQTEGVLLVLLRARGGEPGHWLGWPQRRRGGGHLGLGCAWQRRGSSSARGKRAVKGWGATRWRSAQAGGGLRPPTAAAAPLSAGGQRKQREK